VGVVEVVILWAFDVALSVLEWVFGLLPTMPVIALPGPLVLVVPVPLLAGGTISALNQWFGTALLVAGVLVVGRVLQWLYTNIPGKFT
jgi:hypothetical protein